jgi:hypothetical protein
MATIGSASMALAVCAVGLFAQGKPDNNAGPQATDETYFGQKPPGKKAEIFAPEVMTYETHDSPIMSRDETWLATFGFDEVRFYSMVDGKLALTTNPLQFDIAQIFNGMTTFFNGMAISTSEDKVYFLIWRDGDENFHSITRQEDGWTEPKSLGDAVNSVDTHWQFTVDEKEDLYFGIREQGIVVSVFDGDTYLEPVPLKLEDGSNMPGGTPFIAPDASYIIFYWQDDLYISYNLTDREWTIPQNLGPDINSEALEICPRISPNGKYLFFVSGRVGRAAVTYWADASFVEVLKPKTLE